MALPNKDEIAAIKTFRRNVADVLTQEEADDDMFLLRWLRARDLDLHKAEAMLRNSIIWRNENHLDDRIISKISDPFYYENFPRWVDGIDKEGRPVTCASFGKWDVRKVVRQGKSQEFLEYLTESFEEVMQAIKSSAKMHPPQPGNPPVTQIIFIIDWEGFAWGQLLSYQSVQNFLQIGVMYEAYYPEILHTCYFINCPPIISTALALLRPVIAPKTMSKIQWFGTDKQVWQEELLKRIDAKHLRPQFGGSKEDDFSPFVKTG